MLAWPIRADGQDIDLLVNEIGSYTGVRPLDFEERPAALKMEASGSWQVVVKVAQKAPIWTGKMTAKGDTVFLIPPGTVAGLDTIKITHSGRSNFAVWAYGDRRELLVNEIGTYSGEVLLPSGTVAVVVEADGAWTFEKA